MKGGAWHLGDNRLEDRPSPPVAPGCNLRRRLDALLLGVQEAGFRGAGACETPRRGVPYS